MPDKAGARNEIPFMQQRLLGSALAALLCAGVADAARLHAYSLGPQEARPQIDGRLDEAAWHQAPVFDAFQQFLPEDRQPARWRTTVQLLVDDDALIFGLRAYDDAPALIRAPLTRRDQVRRDQDFVAVLIDPVGLRRSAQFVRINAAGVLADGVFTADDDVEDFAPDFELQAAVQRLDDGYSVELRWPLAALRFAAEGAADWRLMVTRSVPREASHLLVSAPLSSEALSFIAELQPLGGLAPLLARARERSFWTLRPELSWRDSRSPDAPRKRQLSLGAELKWRPRADWVIDATLNPDFSQVELDRPQLAGGSRFALSVPEKRPFFLESSDIVGLGNPDEEEGRRALPAFHSRAIADPDWGLRASWRGAGAQATWLSLRDAGGGQVLRPHAYGTEVYQDRLASQASFARTRMHLEAMGLGALAGLRQRSDGARSAVLGAEAAWRLGEQDQLRGQWLLSRNSSGFDAEGLPQRQAAESGQRGWLLWQHRSETWSRSLLYEQISPRFANDLGFVAQSGFRRVEVQLARRLGGQLASPWAALPLYELEAQLRLQQTRSLADARHGVAAGELIEQRLQPGFWLTSARNSELYGHLGLDRQRARAGGRLHSLRTLTLGAGSNPAPWLAWLGAEVETGRRLDAEVDRVAAGRWYLLEAKLRWALPAGLWLELEPLLERGFVRAEQGGARAYSEAAAQLLSVLHLGPRDSLRAISQRSHYRRAGPASGPHSVDERQRSDSLMFQHRRSLAQSLSLGWSRADEAGGERRRELFVKLVFGAAP